jgi:hypothetical protein
MLVTLHEHRVEGPVEVFLGADARGPHGSQRIEHRTRPERNARGAQCTREVENVFGKAALRIIHDDHSAARSSA